MSVLDPRRIAKLKRLDKAEGSDVFARIAEAFSTQAPERIAEIRQALERADLGAARHAGHSLHGSAAMLGAAFLASALRDLLDHVGAGDLEGCRAQVDDIEAICTIAILELEAITRRN